MSAPHILVVCTANICRSPVGEALLRAKLRTLGLAEWVVSSAGTWAITGNSAAPFSVALLAKRGLDISSHRSRPVNRAVLDRSDLVLCMEITHQQQIQQAFPSFAGKVFTIRQMVDQPGSVRDPYGGNLPDYEQMVAELDRLIEQGFPKIQALAQANFEKRSKDEAS